jgi:hypothetical protein
MDNLNFALLLLNSVARVRERTIPTERLQPFIIIIIVVIIIIADHSWLTV